MNRSIVRAFRTQITPLPLPSHDFTGKTVVITGANSGIGKAAASHFVHLGAQKVILACRSVEKGEKAKVEIESAEKSSKSDVVEVWPLDLGSYASITRFCRRAEETLDRLDVAVANAGLATFECQLYEGYERQTMIHVIAPFTMALLLLPAMRRTADRFQGCVPHYVMVNSNGHMYTKFAPGQAESVFEAVRGDTDMRMRYYDTKLMQVFAARELARRLKQSAKTLVVVNMVDPGYCQSDLLRSNEWELPIRVIMGVADRVLARSGDMGARTYVMAAAAGPDSHGMYLEDCELSTPSPFVETEEGRKLQAKIYEELVGIVEKAVPGACENI
ncbi:hypothetical protein BX600DRAFT_420196 [Xylariales sp. PMI_506]|nr:hypothetical protein BX600DRAFT_420196 [Xylariales sp. PMI_506]